MVGEDRQGAVDLFGKYDAGKLMRQGQTAEGKKKVGALTCCGGPPIRRTDGEHEALNALIADTPDVRGKLLGGVLLAAAIEQNRVRWRAPPLAFKPIKEGRFGLEEVRFAGNISDDTGNVVRNEDIGRGRFSRGACRRDCSEEELQL